MPKTPPRIAVIIPALDEEATIAGVVRGIDRDLVARVVVADNGSRDRTAARARAAGAEVVSAPRRGYGSACLAGIAAAGDATILAFMDGDGSDDPADLPRVVAPVVDGEADLVIGSRVLGRAERFALTPVQRAGNALTCTLVRALFGVRYTDLGPMRAIARPALDALEMRDPDYGWTVEMQVKAAQRGLRVREVPVAYRRRRGGRSKVSGTVTGSARAGVRILSYVAQAWARGVVGRA